MAFEMTVSRLILAAALALAASGVRADATYHPLANGSFQQNWTNTGLIVTNDDWSGVTSLEGHLGDGFSRPVGTDPSTVLAFGTGTLDVNANNSDPSNASSGGVYEVDGGAVIAGNPTVAFQGSGTADAPFLLLRVNTSGCSNIGVSYTLRDIDTVSTAIQPVVLQSRVGESGNFAVVVGTFVANANNGATTAGSATLAAGLENEAQVQLRWITTDATGSDAMIGIDDIQVTGNCADNPPTVASTVPTNGATGIAAGANLSVQFSEAVTTNASWFTLNCATSGTVSVSESGSGNARTLDPAPLLTPSELCTATITGTQVLDEDGTPDAMAANYQWTFTVAPDVAPTVTGNSPANGASGVSPTSNLSVDFSEPVTTGGGWFALNCATSGSVTVTESGSGASRTLDPDNNLASGELCTASITAASVVDLDGTPTPMAVNYQWTFTVAVDNPPTVASTSPANSAASVPIGANLIVNFSEPVSVSGSWYSINCAVSGAHTGVVSGGPTTYTINPAPDFDALESCSVTLTAALVLDQDGTPDPLTSNYVWTFTTAEGAGDYYASIDASTAATLRTTLHALIDDHVAYRYSIGTNNCNLSSPSTAECDVWDILEAAEQDPNNSARILDVYRNRSYAKITDRSGNTGATTYNREHTWPNSLGFNDLQGVDGNNNPYSPYVDGHMLYASASDYNQNRGNKPFDNCNAGCGENPTDDNNGFGGGTGVYPGNSNWVQSPDGNTGTYEVWGHRKGDMARAILYMDVRYEGGSHANGQPEPDLIVTNNRSQIQITASGLVAAQGYMGILDTLLQWHFADPPDEGEILRNSLVQNFQGNRNPFIDHPEWAACLWQNNCAPATVPDAPTGPVAVAGHQRVTVSFTPPVNNGGSTITSYTATCGGQSQSGPASPITVTGLTNGVQVSCTVIATNAVGNSVPSTASNPVTPAPTVPDAPTAVVATRGDGQVVVAFAAPQNDGGSAILNYTATCGAQSGMGVTSPVVVLGLTNGVPVSCTVVATNGFGPSLPSTASNTVTPAGAPGAPTNVIATAGNAQVSVAFSFPNANGSPITSYTAQCTGSATFTGPSSPIVVTGLANGTPVTCTVFATNGVGNGTASAPSNTVTPATVPGAPTAVVASAGSGQVTVAFSPPASNGGSAITGYTATCGAQSQSGAGSPIVVSGLTNGVPVTCTVIATNGIGNSPASAPSGTVTPSEGIFANGFE